MSNKFILVVTILFS